MVKCVKIVYETFLQNDKCEFLCKEFYSGPSRSLLACIFLSIIEDRCCDILKDWCFCGVWNWDILRKLCITWSNIILSKRVRNYNVMVLKKRYKRNISCVVNFVAITKYCSLLQEYIHYLTSYVFHHEIASLH